MTMYRRNDTRTKKLVDSTDLHILHSMNPDGFENAEKSCNGTIGRLNANNVNTQNVLPKNANLIYNCKFQVDLNRDFPSYFDLYENKQSLRKLTQNRQPETQVGNDNSKYSDANIESPFQGLNLHNFEDMISSKLKFWPFETTQD